MNKFFIPAVRLMNRFKYSQKFLVISLLFLIMIAGLTSLLLSTLNQQIDLSKTELQGIHYIKPTMTLLIDVQKHRGLSYGYLNGAKSLKSQLLKIEVQIDKDIKNLENKDKQYGSTFKTTKLLSDIKNQWSQIKADSLTLSPLENFKKHTVLANKILFLISYTGRTSAMILDPDVGTSTIIRRLPLLIENIAQARGTGTGVVAKGHITSEEKNILILTSGIINYYISEVTIEVIENFERYPAAKNKLNPYIQESRINIKTFLNELTSLIKGESIDIPTDLFFHSSSRAVNSVYKLFNKSTDSLEQLINDRIHRLHSYRLLLLLSLALVLCVSAYLFAGFYLSVISTISTLKDTSREVANGNFAIRANVQTQDELKSLADSLNTMTENLSLLFQRKNFLREIMLTSVGSLNIKDTLHTIVTQTGQQYNADRCFIIEYDTKSQEFIPIKDFALYTSSSKIETVVGLKFTDEIFPFTKQLFKTREVLTIEDASKLDLSENARKIYQKYKTKSFMAVPIFYRDIPLGLLVFDYINKYKKFTREESDLFSIIAGQSAIVIHQAQLFNDIQDAKNREELLREINNNILESKTLDCATDNIVNELGAMFNVDRVALRLFDADANAFTEVKSEYRKYESIPSAVGMKTYPKEVDNFILKLLTEQYKICPINCIDDPQLPEAFRETFKTLGIKSTIIVPIHFQNNLLAIIFVTNTKNYTVWKQEDINLLTSIAQQVAIGIHLFNLNASLLRSLETEKTIRDLITIIRQSQNHDTIYDYILESMLKVFNVNRSMHIHYHPNGDLYVKNEKLQDTSQTPMLNTVILNKNNISELIPKNQNNIIVINDVDSEIQYSELKTYLLNNGIKSFILYADAADLQKNQEKDFGGTMACSMLAKRWTTEEIKNFQLIINTALLVCIESMQRKQAEEVKATFLATLTHDLRSPLNAEQKALEAILSEKLGTSLESYSEYLEDIYKTNEELLRIVNNILTVYHYESGKFILNLKSASIEDVINDAVRPVKSLAANEGSEITINIQPGLPLADIDRNEVARVCMNLINNAIKHNKKETAIRIEAKKTDGSIQISVSDNGKGIPESEKPNIFQRYPTAKRKIGTGLGLYLSKQIVDAHNGKIWFESKEGQGTTFYFTLPISY